MTKFPDRTSPMASLIRARLDALSSRKSAQEIAEAIGYQKSNMLRMFAEGETRVPIDKAVQLAMALETDPGDLYRMAIEQFSPLPRGIRISYEFEGIPERLVDLNFKVPDDFHREFKIAAAGRGWTMRHLLEHCFRDFVDRDQSGALP